MREIVGARIGNTITNDAKQICAAIEAGLVREYLDRQSMQLMAAMDLGEHWKRMAEGPTLFVVPPENEK